jgi:hypothetical protein
LAEWLIEEGIGESRAILVENERVLAAKLFWPSKCCARTILMAKITSKKAGSARAVCVSTDGVEINVSGLPRDATEGSDTRIIITREPMAERGRLKRAQGRYFGDDRPYTPPVSVFTTGTLVRRFPSGLWEDVWSLASEQEMQFEGGSLVFSVTPAMTLIDIDGFGSAKELSLAAVPAIAEAVRWLDLGGSVGIDFPTIESKSDRKAVDAALADALEGWSHERTAMNGFGFVQLVARLDEPPLLHRLHHSRSAACARILLRRAEMVEGPGVLLLKSHPAVTGQITEEWLIELRQRTGRDVRVESDPTLALEGGFAQAVSL